MSKEINNKDFVAWHELKAKIDAKVNLADIKQGQIWWCILGANIGHEEDGKGEKFSRPVLVVRKFNRNLFWGVPLSTQIKDKFHYHKITFHGKTQSAMLSQLKLYSTKRLTAKMGQLEDDELERIKGILRGMI